MYDSTAQFIILAIPLALLVVAVIKALSKRPGYRRKSYDSNYTGPWRRCNDAEKHPGNPCANCPVIKYNDSSTSRSHNAEGNSDLSTADRG